jgi:hypothetical protein
LFGGFVYNFQERISQMTIIVDIPPEVQAELARQASARGRALEAYAASLLEQTVHLSTEPHPAKIDPERNSLMEIFDQVRGLADDVSFSRNPSTGRPLNFA